MVFGAFLELLREFFFLFARVGTRSSFPRALSQKEEDALLVRAEAGDAGARCSLVEHNLRLVAHVVKKYASARIEQEDLISIGTIGLIKAVNSFQRGYNTKLSTYAARCIENEVLMFMRQMRRQENEVSLSEPVGMDSEGNELTNMDILNTGADDVADDVFRRMQLEKVARLSRQVLTEREREVFYLRFGIPDGHSFPQREIARRLGISRSYVSRIEKKALEKLREALGKDGLPS